MLLRIGGGANASLSIPRDTIVDIPGHGRNKINAAYAFGGPALATQTVKDYTGLEINHVVEVSFENFPQLIDALGGVTYKGGCVVSKINGGKQNGGFTLRLKKGETEIDGEQALALARTRKNECAPQENDLDRARRQQQLVAAMKDKVTSFETFVRLPWVSWAAPRAVRSDMSRPDAAGRRGRVVHRRRRQAARARAERRRDAARRRRGPGRRRRREAGRGRALPARLTSAGGRRA